MAPLRIEIRVIIVVVSMRGFAVGDAILGSIVGEKWRMLLEEYRRGVSFHSYVSMAYTGLGLACGEMK